MFSHVPHIAVILKATEDKFICLFFSETFILVTLDLSFLSPPAIVALTIVINKAN